MTNAPTPPTISEPLDWAAWNAVHDYFRALFRSQQIGVQWLGEQATGVTPVYIDRPLTVQWQALAPIAVVLTGRVREDLDTAMAEGRGNEWVSLSEISCADWVEIKVTT